jgi:hypothetical protein
MSDARRVTKACSVPSKKVTDVASELLIALQSASEKEIVPVNAARWPNLI